VERPVRLFQLALAVWVGVWLVALPLRLRHHSLPNLLARLTPAARGRRSRSPHELDRAVRVVVKICQRRCFRLSIFPRACLRQALTLYYILSRLGHPVTIHFGVHKAGDVLHGHSWITVDGLPVMESLPPGIFRQVYSYASVLACGLRADQDDGREGRIIEGEVDGHDAHAAHTR
jgi:hypothetical protein